MLDASGRTQHRFVLDAGFQIKRKNGVGYLKRFGGSDVSSVAANGDIHAVSSSAACIDDLGLDHGPFVVPAVHNLPAERNVHADVAVEKKPIHKGDVTRKNLPGAGLQCLAQRRNVERLFNLDVPHRTLPQLRPFHHRS